MASEHLRELWRAAQRRKRARDRAAAGLPPIRNRRGENRLKAHAPPAGHPWRRDKMLERSVIIERDEPRDRLSGEDLQREFGGVLDLAAD